MNEDQIRDALTDSLQGNMREIIGTQCLKELCNDRKTFGDEAIHRCVQAAKQRAVWLLLDCVSGKYLWALPTPTTFKKVEHTFIIDWLNCELKDVYKRQGQ